VRGNSAGSGSFGGGIEANGNLLLVHSAVTGNTAGSSGRIDMNFATVSLISSSVTDTRPRTTPILRARAAELGAAAVCLRRRHREVQRHAAHRGGGLRTSSTIQDGRAVMGITVLAGSSRIDGNAPGDQGGGIFSAPYAGDASLTFQVADGTPSYTDPLTGSRLPARTGSVSGNTPDQCVPVLTLGAHTYGLAFEHSAGQLRGRQPPAPRASTRRPGLTSYSRSYGLDLRKYWSSAPCGVVGVEQACEPVTRIVVVVWATQRCKTEKGRAFTSKSRGVVHRNCEPGDPSPGLRDRNATSGSAMRKREAN
jgi:hypothetical protein